MKFLSTPRSDERNNTNEKLNAPALNIALTLKKKTNCLLPLSALPNNEKILVALVLTLGFSLTKNISINTATIPGINETRKIDLRSITCSKTNATSGPTIAPIWSRVLCKPNALPCFDADTDSEISASRGAVLIPLPILSEFLIRNVSNQLPDNEKNGLLTVDNPYPHKTSVFRFPTLSDSVPDNILNA